jgi:hypothetical protein
MCTQITEEELLDFKRKTEAFLLSCKNRYPGVSKDLADALVSLVEHLVPGENDQAVFRYASYKHLLRWSITPGRHLQDHRRDNARALWRSLFRGRFPQFYRWNTMTKTYDEYPEDLRIWIESQVTDVAAPADAA